MNIAQYIQENSPITNIPDLLNLHHGNPLGISPLAQVIFIFVVVEVMAFFNFFIRNREKSQYYPILYSLFFVSLVSIYYYCFQSGLPMSHDADVNELQPCIGWFCQRDCVGWGWAIVGLIVLVHVIYSLLCAVMQVAAQLTVEAKLVEGKKWKEWKWALVMVMLGILVMGIFSFTNPVLSSWALLVLCIFIVCFVVGKIIADGVRCHNFLWSTLIGMTFLVGMVAAIMLSIECLRGMLFLFAFILTIFSTAKASKKQLKREE